jgi:uncharacterized protein (DUF305 family)
MNLFSSTPCSSQSHSGRENRSACAALVIRYTGCFAILAVLWCSSTAAQQSKRDEAPVVVQPGAPGAPTKRLSPSTRGVLPPQSTADAQFVQEMILHHAQAVEMTAMIPSHTENRNLKSLGARISSSQVDEIKFMKRWLALRGQSVPGSTANMPGMNMAKDPMPLMPGMLTPEQMQALRNARGEDFDRRFLRGMIQHHNGALTMVKDLFDTAGAGQDAELFSFATDVDNTQRVEIRIMQGMLGNQKSEENP